MKIIHIEFSVYFPTDDEPSVRSYLTRYESGNYEEIDIKSIETKNPLGPIQSVVLTYVENYANKNSLKLRDVSISHHQSSVHYFYTLSDS